MSSKNSGRSSQSTGKRRKMQERSSESKEDDATSSDDSCEEEENEEIVDPFSCPKGFYRRAKSLAARDWANACRSFIARVEEITNDSKELASKRFCEPCGKQAPWVMVPVSNSLAMSTYALQEYSRRYLRALRDVNTGRVEKEEQASKSKEQEVTLRRLAEEKKEVERERDQLREEQEKSLKRLKEEVQEGDRLYASLTKSKEREEKLKMRFAEEKKEADLERDQLRAALATRENREEDLRRMAQEKEGVERERDQFRAALTAREEDREREARASLPPRAPNQRRQR